MWHTNIGDRTLEGAEARLFAETLWDFLCELEIEDGDFDAGQETFDSLTYGQKVSVLSTVGNNLLRQEVPICKLTAAVESAIAAIYEYLKELVIIEIDEPSIPSCWRKLILAAGRESGVENLPDEDSKSHQEWLILIEELSYLILWDYDFEDADQYMDISPDRSNELKKLMSIKKDYFVDVPDDLKPENIQKSLSELKTLCREICET